MSDGVLPSRVQFSIQRESIGFERRQDRSEYEEPAVYIDQNDLGEHVPGVAIANWTVESVRKCWSYALIRTSSRQTK
jgi:hypothetical protein